MDPDDRLAKKRREAEALRPASPGETLVAGARLTMFALELAAAADHAGSG